MSTTMIRAETKARIVELLRTDRRLGPNRVYYGLPPEGIPIEGVWLDRSTGRMPVAAMTASRLPRNDEWVIDVTVFAGLEGQTAEQAERRAQELFAPVEDTLADNPHLGGVIDGLKFVVLDEDCVIYAEADGDGEGFVGRIHGGIRCRARLS